MRISALLTAAFVVLTLAGCQTADPVVVPQPEPSTTPLFASEEEALAAAEEAFGAYLAVADQIFADGGAEPERLKAVATQSVYDQDLEGFKNYEIEGKRSTGGSTFDSLQLQSADLSGYAFTSVVVAYLCEDFSAVEVFDSGGSLVSDPSRQTRWPIVATFDAADDGELVVAEVEQWTGDDFCVD